jgi:general secretion pathway protein G
VNASSTLVSSRRASGFTLLELMIVLAIIATLSAMVVPRYSRAIEQSQETVAVDDIKAIQTSIASYQNQHGSRPATLDDLPDAPFIDPWGNPYQYLDLSTTKGRDKSRKDKFLHPLNTAYDLYSMGPDGDSQIPLMAKASRDDVIRANDGGFVGVAELY